MYQERFSVHGVCLSSERSANARAHTHLHARVFRNDARAGRRGAAFCPSGACSVGGEKRAGRCAAAGGSHDYQRVEPRGDTATTRRGEGVDVSLRSAGFKNLALHTNFGRVSMHRYLSRPRSSTYMIAVPVYRPRLGPISAVWFASVAAAKRFVSGERPLAPKAPGHSAVGRESRKSRGPHPESLRRLRGTDQRCLDRFRQAEEDHGAVSAEAGG
jgi:hypothetical protein